MMVATAGLGWPPQAYPNGLPVMGVFVPARSAAGNGLHGADGNGAASGAAGLGWRVRRRAGASAGAPPRGAVLLGAASTGAALAGARPAGQSGSAPPPPARLREVLSGVSRETLVGGRPTADQRTATRAASAVAPTANQQVPAHGGVPGYPYPDGPVFGVTAPIMATHRATVGNSEDEPGKSED